MKSYLIIKEISEKLYTNIENVKDIEIRLKSEVSKIHSQISKDFKTLFGKELKLKDFYIYIDDQTYRQSATSLILNEVILNHEEFKIRVECLIDLGRI